MRLYFRSVSFFVINDRPGQRQQGNNSCGQKRNNVVNYLVQFFGHIASKMMVNVNLMIVSFYRAKSQEEKNG